LSTFPGVKDAYDQSLRLLSGASSTAGFLASPSFEHYAGIWTRDAAITSLGALVTDDEDLIDTSIDTFKTIGAAASPTGQIAAVVWPGRNSWDWGEGGAVDASAWYVILAGALLDKTGDRDLVGSHWPTIRGALNWLRHQDVTGSGLISCAPATDWMDSSLTRSGRTLSLNVLYYWAAKVGSRIGAVLGESTPVDPNDVSWRINLLFWPTSTQGPELLFAGSGVESVPSEFPHQATADAYRAAARPGRSHYLSHVVHSLFDEHCDVLANLLAVCLALPADEERDAILDYLAGQRVSEPFPTRDWAQPILEGSGSAMRILDAEAHIDPRWHNPPYCYHNGGVWPYIGGLHVAALAKAGRMDVASDLLEGLGRANLAGNGGPWGFHEWLHGQTGEPRGAPNQAWNAGMYVLAWHSVNEAGNALGIFD
jgi:hypothetical protein